MQSMKANRWVLAVLATACAAPRPLPPAIPVEPNAGAMAAPVEEGARIALVEQGLLPAVYAKGEGVGYALEERMHHHAIPGLSIAVFEHYELAWAKAYGVPSVAAPEPATTHTLFLAGSISKSVNALAALFLVADGALSLDAPINDALESWKLPDSDFTRAAPVTLRQLLSHTAGTTVHGFAGYEPGEPLPTLPQILDGAPPANTPPVRVESPPGTLFRYSGGGTTIVQLALVERSKQDYAGLLQQRVLGPLGMRESTFEQILPPERARFAAVGYDATGRAIDGGHHVYPEMAAAGLWTTPSDLARFFAELGRGRSGSSPLVSNAIALQMTTRAGPHSSAGLGVFLFERNGVPYFGHEGADHGFRALALASLEGGNGLVIMANSDNGSDIFGEIERAVFAAHGWPGQTLPLERFATTAAQRAPFTGRFQLGPVPFAIVARGERLVVREPFLEPVDLIAIAADRVVASSDGSEIRVGSRGNIERVVRDRPPQPLARQSASEPQPLFLLEEGHFEQAVAAWKSRLAQFPATARPEEDYGNQLGLRLLPKHVSEAVDVMRLIVAVFPDSSNAHDSLALAYRVAGDTNHAISEYEASLATLEHDARASEAFKTELRENARKELAKLRSTY